VFGVIILLAAPGDLVWLTPVILGLVLSIPLAVWTSDPFLGAQLKQWGLFTTPEEHNPPTVLLGLASLADSADQLDEAPPKPLPTATALAGAATQA
jgi:membrane glycosyltransferase